MSSVNLYEEIALNPIIFSSTERDEEPHLGLEILRVLVLSLPLKCIIFLTLLKIEKFFLLGQALAQTRLSFQGLFLGCYNFILCIVPACQK